MSLKKTLFSNPANWWVAIKHIAKTIKDFVVEKIPDILYMLLFVAVIVIGCIIYLLIVALFSLYPVQMCVAVVLIALFGILVRTKYRIEHELPKV